MIFKLLDEIDEEVRALHVNGENKKAFVNTENMISIGNKLQKVQTLLRDLSNENSSSYERVKNLLRS